MHKEILSITQLELLPLVKKFAREFYLVGGTAIALYIGHRRSIDFDLFKFNQLNHHKIVSKISALGYPFTITRKVKEQLNLTIEDVHFTFFEYPFKIDAKNILEDRLRLPDLIDLAAMKAYALGRRSKWKDYVDIYFILRNYFTIEQISQRANEIYEQLFSEKLFRAQLSYFDDIDHSEKVEYLIPAVSEDEIKNFLVNKSTEIQL